jgi:hypothetical protein
MRLFYPGQAALPLMLVLFAVLSLIARFGVLPVAGYWNLWPIGLIATGLEELYLWAASGDNR